MGVEKIKIEKEKLKIYLLNDEEYEGVENYPVIETIPLVSSIEFSNIDYLIFTSKNSVKITNSITDEWKKYPSVAIGESTAKIIEELGGKVDLISSGYGESLAKDIDYFYQGKTFLWLRAEKVITKLKYYVNFNIIKEKIIYKTKCKKTNKQINKPAIIIFTSPSTITCFKKQENLKNIIPIAIGKKTKEKLKEKNIKKILIPDKPSIKNCIKIAKSIINTNNYQKLTTDLKES